MQVLNQSIHSQRMRSPEEKKRGLMLMRNICKRYLFRNITSSSMDIHVSYHLLDAINGLMRKSMDVVSKEDF